MQFVENKFLNDNIRHEALTLVDDKQMDALFEQLHPGGRSLLALLRRYTIRPLIVGARTSIADTHIIGEVQATPNVLLQFTSKDRTHPYLDETRRHYDHALAFYYKSSRDRKEGGQGYYLDDFGHISATELISLPSFYVRYGVRLASLRTIGVNPEILDISAAWVAETLMPEYARLLKEAPSLNYIDQERI